MTEFQKNQVRKFKAENKELRADLEDLRIKLREKARQQFDYQNSLKEKENEKIT